VEYLFITFGGGLLAGLIYAAWQKWRR